MTGPRLKELIWRTGRVVPELAALNGVLLLVTGNDDLEMSQQGDQAFKLYATVKSFMEQKGY